MKTTTCAIPDVAGSGSAGNEEVMSGESGPVGRQPSAMAPAALAVLVKKVRRFMISRGYPRGPRGVRSRSSDSLPVGGIIQEGPVRRRRRGDGDVPPAVYEGKEDQRMEINLDRKSVV